MALCKLLAALILFVGCAQPVVGPAAGDDFAFLRETMVVRTIERPSDRPAVKDSRVLAAMRAVPRHEFVPEALRSQAYADHPLPIGEGQTISQPYIVALMTELLRLDGDEKVLEIGTGSGYQAAVLAEIVGATNVYTIEIIRSLSEQAQRDLERTGYGEVHCKVGDGYAGWPEHAPFDAVIVTAAPPSMPRPLLDQLAPGGRLVAPVGRGYQELQVLTRTEDGFRTERSIPVRFVPMTGEAQQH